MAGQKQGKKWIAAAALIIPAVAAAVIFSSERRTYLLQEWWMLRGEPRAVQCWDYAKRDLRDPDSAQLKSFQSSGSNKVVLTYRAMNGFGAFGQGRYQCLVTANRTVGIPLD